MISVTFVVNSPMFPSLRAGTATTVLATITAAAVLLIASLGSPPEQWTATEVERIDCSAKMSTPELQADEHAFS